MDGESGRLQSMGSIRVGHEGATSLSLFTFIIGERNGNPLQCSCLENPRDGGAWWAAVYGVAQSQHRLKRLSSSNSKGFCGASLVAQLVKNLPEMQETAVRFLGSRKIFWRRGRLPTQILLGVPGGSDGKESSFSAEDLGLIPELGRSPGGEHGNPLQYSCLENPSGQRSLVGHSPRGRKELDTTE